MVDLFIDSGRKPRPISELKSGVHVSPSLLPQPPFLHQSFHLTEHSLWPSLSSKQGYLWTTCMLVMVQDDFLDFSHLQWVYFFLKGKNEQVCNFSAKTIGHRLCISIELWWHSSTSNLYFMFLLPNTSWSLLPETSVWPGLEASLQCDPQSQWLSLECV